MENTAQEIFYLASSSPRRQQLLQDIGIRYKILLGTSPEPPHPKKINKFNDLSVVMDIAQSKAMGAYKKLKNKKKAGGIILAADTLVFHNYKILGKPKTKNEAQAMLKNLSNNTHTVATGIALLKIQEGKIFLEERRLVTTNVTFRKISKLDLDWYLKTGESMDKAGAYGAQGYGAVFIEKIEGSYTNVVGLPLAETMELIEEVTGLPWNIWTH